MSDSLDAVTEAIREVTGLAVVTPDARLEADLQLESIDLLAIDAVLRDRFGESVQFCAHFADLSIDEIIALTVDDMATYVDTAR